MRKCSIILIAIVLSLGVIGSAAMYYRHHSEHDLARHGNYFIKYIEQNLTKKLELNEAQKAELNQLTQSLTTMLVTGKKTFKEQKIVGLNEILSLLDADKLNQENAIKIVRERLSMIESHAKEMISSASGFTDSLTNEQREELKEIIQQRISE